MGKEDFIRDAHFQPSEYKAYHVGRRLAELYPDKAILAGEAGYFDLEGFVRAGKCAVVSETSVFNQITTDWMGPRKRLELRTKNSWLNVLWQGHLIDVVFLTFSEACYATRHHWIVAEDKKIGEAFFSEVCDWSAEVRGEVLVFQDGAWMKNAELLDAIKNSTFDNLILADRLKEVIQDDFAQFFASREVYERHGIPWKRGVLFIGPPGNGKTHAVKALVNQLGRSCLYVRGFKSEYATDQENIRLVFERARMTIPCVVVLEDLDSMIDDNSRAFFLNELDGFEANKGIVVLATTNYAERLDPAILDRPSRFDRKYYFQLPANSERSAYVTCWNEKLNADLQVSGKTIDQVVGLTDGFSFAYLKELFLSSMMRWTSCNKELSMDQIVCEQAGLLRSQMASDKDDKSTAEKPDRKQSKLWQLLKR